MRRIGNMVLPSIFWQWWEYVDLYTILNEGGEELIIERRMEALKEKKDQLEIKEPDNLKLIGSRCTSVVPY